MNDKALFERCLAMIQSGTYPLKQAASVEFLCDDLRAAIAQQESAPSVPMFDSWSADDGYSWYENPADAELIFEVLGNSAKVGDEFEVTAEWNSTTAKYRITKASTGDDFEVDEFEVECISHKEFKADAAPVAPAPEPTMHDPNHPERNWPEDASHKNGEYYNRCHRCRCIFIGNKRRTECKVCASSVAPAEAKVSDEPVDTGKLWSLFRSALTDGHDMWVTADDEGMHYEMASALKDEKAREYADKAAALYRPAVALSEPLESVWRVNHTDGTSTHFGHRGTASAFAKTTGGTLTEVPMNPPAALHVVPKPVENLSDEQVMEIAREGMMNAAIKGAKA